MTTVSQTYQLNIKEKDTTVKGLVDILNYDNHQLVLKRGLRGSLVIAIDEKLERELWVKGVIEGDMILLNYRKPRRNSKNLIATMYGEDDSEPESYSVQIIKSKKGTEEG